MTTPPRDPFSEVVDERRRWRPEWYQWLKEVSSATTSGSTPGGGIGGVPWGTIPWGTTTFATNTYTVTLTVAVPGTPTFPVDGTLISFRANTTNTGDNPGLTVVSPSGTIPAAVIVNNGFIFGVRTGDIGGLSECLVRWNAANFNWVLLEQTYLPVQQGGGLGGQTTTNKLKIGWTGTQLRATVDTTDLGPFFFGTPPAFPFVVYRASGGNDTPGLNAAILALPQGGLSSVGATSPVGTVWCPDPLYTFTAAASAPNNRINVPRGVRIVGMGSGTVLGNNDRTEGTEFRVTASMTDLFIFNDAPGAGLQDILITALAPAVLTNAFTFTGTVNFNQCLFRRVSLQGPFAGGPAGLGIITRGFNFGTSVTATPVSFKIYECFINNVTTGIFGSNAANGAGFIDIFNTTFGGGTNAINTIGMAISLLNSYCQSQTGVAIIASGKTAADMGFVFLAINTLVDSSGGNGYQLANFSNVEISGGLSASACNGDGINMTNCTNFKLNCHVEVCVGDGIMLTKCALGTINGCLLVNNASGGNGAASGVGSANAITMVNCTGITVTGNRANNISTLSTNLITFGDTTTLSAGTTIIGHQGVGLACDANTQNIIISGNDFDGNAAPNTAGGQLFVAAGAAAIRFTHTGGPWQIGDLVSIPAGSCPGSTISMLNINVAAWGVPVAAGASQCRAYCDGSNWTVMGA